MHTFKWTGVGISISTGVAPSAVRTTPPKATQPKRKSNTSATDIGGPSRGGRKERDPNWNMMEMLALVRAKRKEFMEDLEVDDPRTLMQSEGSKWERIALFVNVADGLTCYRSPDACKYKWQTLLPDYK